MVLATSITPTAGQSGEKSFKMRRARLTDWMADGRVRLCCVLCNIVSAFDFRPTFLSSPFSPGGITTSVDMPGRLIQNAWAFSGEMDHPHSLGILAYAHAPV